MYRLYNKERNRDRDVERVEGTSVSDVSSSSSSETDNTLFRAESSEEEKQEAPVTATVVDTQEGTQENVAGPTGGGNDDDDDKLEVWSLDKVMIPKKNQLLCDDLRKQITCPITYLVFSDPVVAEDGHTYERDFITRHLNERGISPMTRERMSRNLYPNLLVKNIVHQYYDEVPMKVDYKITLKDGNVISNKSNNGK